jgi:hypothetical protein
VTKSRNRGTVKLERWMPISSAVAMGATLLNPASLKNHKIYESWAKHMHRKINLLYRLETDVNNEV